MYFSLTYHNSKPNNHPDYSQHIADNGSLSAREISRYVRASDHVDSCRMPTQKYPPDMASSPPAVRVGAACLVASVISVLMFLSVVIFRSGYPTPVGALAKIAGLSLLLVNVGTFARKSAWFLCGPMITLYVLLAIVALGWSGLGDNKFAAAIAAAAGMAAALWNLILVLRRLGLWRSVALLALGISIGLYMEGMYWGAETEHNIFYPEGVVTGQDRTDVLFETAIVEMISTYRVASTGLEGVLPLKYHTGSFWIGEAFRRLCGFQAIEFTAFGYGILLVPFYVGAFLGCAEILARVLQKDAKALPFMFWIVCLVALIGLVPFPENLVRANFNIMTISSDSSLLGLALVLLFIGVAVHFCDSLRATDYELSAGQSISAALFLPVVLALIGFVKISDIYLCLALLAYLYWRIRRIRSWPFTTGLAASFLILGLMLREELGAGRTVISPLRFDRVHPEWIPYFFVIHFAWAWLFLLVWKWRYRTQTIAQFADAARAGLTIPLELVFVSVVAGLVPYLLLYLNNPSWVYFTAFHALLAGLFVAALQSPLSGSVLWRQFRDGTLPLSTLIAMLFVLVVLGNVGASTLGSTYRLLKGTGEIRAVLDGKPASQWRSGIRQIRAGRTPLDQKFATPRRVIACLEGIGGQPRDQRKASALYIPKTNRAYWDMRQSDFAATPFIAPSFAGVAMVSGLPEYDDVQYAAIGWGYPQYQMPSGPEVPTENLAQAVEKAKADGFQKLLVFRAPSAEDCELESIIIH